MPIALIYKELNRLIDDYYKCPFKHIKEQILIDINLLTEAILLFDADYSSDVSFETK
ncbi:hypothetical protein SAMN05518871_11320 [Psychrobacillus sp. OK028]|uniref:hypothetical protein n=1 Tax=Psychrobacillus sp. OK028 TaxID=1884359 RepID=UPI000882CAA1|nr:hypothetical protein [Psychrobacillus sp. OK028]SDO24372.1 hypothetical protein SAMN05518871_11320 [Psychrobacillus sp. OK028]